MDKYEAQKLIEKILERDFSRWIRYVDETGIIRSAYKQSFPQWKAENKMDEQDAAL